MFEVVEKYYQIGISIFVFILSATFTGNLLWFAREPIIVQGSDKTFIESTGVQEHYDSELFGYDILLMLMNVDDMTPYPRAIRINDGPIIKIDNSYVAYKMKNVALIYDAEGDYKLSLMLNYKVTTQEYIYDIPGTPYIQYTLEEVG